MKQCLKSYKSVNIMMNWQLEKWTQTEFQKMKFLIRNKNICQGINHMNHIKINFLWLI